MEFDFSKEKNKILKKSRDVSFEEVIMEIKSGNLLDVIPHFNKDKYPNQRLFILKLNWYIHYVPFVEDNNKIFLKNIIPSRKFNKIYN